jgi:hypothetical protein
MRLYPILYEEGAAVPVVFPLLTVRLTLDPAFLSLTVMLVDQGVRRAT